MPDPLVVEMPGPPVVVPAPDGTPPVATTQVTTVTTGQATQPPGWLSSNLRNVVAVALLLDVLYLSTIGSKEAQIAIIQTFVALMAFIWGERTALKRPGQDS